MIIFYYIYKQKIKKKDLKKLYIYIYIRSCMCETVYLYKNKDKQCSNSVMYVVKSIQRKRKKEYNVNFVDMNIVFNV